MKRKIKNLKACEEITCKSTKENIKNVRFRNVMARDGGGNKEGHGTPYVKTICEILQGQVQLCAEVIIICHVEPRSIYRS